MSQPPPILDIKNAQVFRGKNKIFNGLNLCLPHGKNVAILGPNGAGKTTLLKLITRELYPVVRPDSHIQIFGEELVKLWELRKKIGLVSHEFQQQYQALATGLDVVVSAFFGSVGIHQHQHSTAEQIAQATETLAHHKLTELKDKQFLQLSTGQQRRLLLARAMIHKPEVLILDEPTASLDVSAAFQLISDIRALVGKGLTLILVTHHIEEIIPEIERVIILKDRKIRHDGEKHEVLTSDILSEAFNTPLRVSENCGYFQWVPYSSST